MGIKKFKKGLVCGIITIFICTGIVSGISGNIDYWLNVRKSNETILVYITEDGTGYRYDTTWFDDALPMFLEDHGYSVTITDRNILPQITDSLLTSYDELWILSTNPYSTGCFSSSEITTILNYRDAGNGLLIMADHQSDTQNYQVDANQIATPLGVTFYGFTDHGPHSGPITPDFADHPLFADVETIVGSNSEGNMYVNNPSEIIATFHGDNMITILDDGKGRVVFDVCIGRLFDPYIDHDREWILVGDTPQYIKNIADWLSNQSPDTPSKPLGIASGKTGIEYTYRTSTIDPDGNQVWFKWDWGDGSYSEWRGPNSSGQIVSASHAWSIGDYSIRVKARDSHGDESDWSDPLVVSMPKNQINNRSVILSILRKTHGAFSSAHQIARILMTKSKPPFLFLQQL